MKQPIVNQDCFPGFHFEIGDFVVCAVGRLIRFRRIVSLVQNPQFVTPRNNLHTACFDRRVVQGCPDGGARVGVDSPPGTDILMLGEYRPFVGRFVHEHRSKNRSIFSNVALDNLMGHGVLYVCQEKRVVM